MRLEDGGEVRREGRERERESEKERNLTDLDV